MATFPGPSNAIAYAQFRLQGGWRGTAIIAGITFALLAGLAVMQTVAAVTGGQPAAAALQEWPQGLLFVQVVFLFVIGPFRVTAAVRGDVASRMVESHRLMPMTPAGVVAGYVAGGPWVAVVLAAVTAAFGAACCLIADRPVGDYAVANMALAVSALCAACVTAHLAMVSRFGVLALVVVALFSLTGTAPDGPARLLPGLAVLTAPLVSRSVLLLGANSVDLPSAAVAYAGQLTLAALCFRAAMRLYRRPAAVGLSAPLGLGLLTLWVGLSVVGLGWPATFTAGRLRRFHGISSADQLVASTVATMLLAGMPLAAEAKAAAARRRSGERPSAATARVAAGVLLTAMAVTVALPVLTTAIVRDGLSFQQATVTTATTAPAAGGWPPVQSLYISGYHQAFPDVHRGLLLTPTVVVAALLGLAFVYRLAYLRLERAWFVTAVWVFLTWVAPLIVDAATSTSLEIDGLGTVGSLSPIGAVIELWAQAGHDPLGGIVAQFVVAAVPAGLWGVALANARRRRTGLAAS